MWKAVVVPSSIGLETTGYAHKAVNGSREITVTHHWHQNYDHIVKRELGNGYVEAKGVDRRKPDLTPHPEAIAVACALNTHCPPGTLEAINKVRKDFGDASLPRPHQAPTDAKGA